MTPLLALKLILVPFFLAALSAAGRRWGPGVAGWLAGLPLVTGPILLLLTLEYGRAFAAQAASASLSAVLGAVCFNLAYARTCARRNWLASLGAGIGAWFMATLLLSQIQAGPWVSLGVALATLLVAPRLFPRPGALPETLGLPRHEIFLRMVAGAALTLAVTTVAAPRLGTTWTGLLSVFPMLGLVLAVFSHRASGAAFAITLLRAMVSGLYSLSTFCFSLALLLPGHGIALSFSLSAAAALCVQWLCRIKSPWARRGS